MIKDYCGDYCLIDGQLAATDVLGKIDLNPAGIFYEVIRVMDGIFLFLDDHLHRLEESINKIYYNYTFNFKLIYETLLKYRFNISLQTGNIKVVVSICKSKPSVIIFYQIPHHYPSEKQYKEGVQVSLIHLERLNPNIKQYNFSLQQKYREKIAENKVFELILVDQNNNVTEGSRSNIFFISDKSIFTAPSENVLKGITREKVIEICNKLKYNLIQNNISTNNLNKFRAAFLTGTSPKVLPIASLESISYSSMNPCLRAIMNQYDLIIADYIQNHKEQIAGSA